MYDHERDSLKKIAGILKKRFDDRLVSVYAFGSRVRGNHDAWSDFDVLIIVKNKNSEIETEIISIFVDEEMKSGLSFAPVIKDIKLFELEKKYNTPFYENIIREGVTI